MSFENLFYSKCPHCRKHGIRAWKTSVGRSANRTVTCKYCKKKFYANVGWSTLATFLVLGGIGYLRIGVLDEPLATLPGWLRGLITVGVILFLALPIWYVLNYFLPLHEEE